MAPSNDWADAPEIRVALPNSPSAITLPKGWTRADPSEPVTVLSPEGDLRCTFVVTQTAGTADETSRVAWRQINPEFQYPIHTQGEVPSTEGWAKVSQVIYNLPSSEGRMVLTIVRTLGSQAYVILIDGSKAAVSRRMAQVSEMLEAWKPAGLKSVNLAASKQPAWGSEQSRALSEFIRDGMERCSIPGVGIAIVQNGGIVFAEGFGVREIGKPELVTRQTRFMIGSSTKPLTTLMMGRLIDQGAFTWTTPVTHLLPDFALADPEVTRKLQMRHTVCACTGMPRRDLEFVFRVVVTPEQRLESMREMRPTTGFGETFQYSNLLVAVGGYAAAAAFSPKGGLEAAYDAAMKTLVFEPLGMANSFIRTREALNGNWAYPHGLDFENRCVPIDLAMEGSVESVAPAGGAWSTVEDIAEYLLLELNGGMTRGGTRLLSQETLHSRWSGGIKINDKLEYGLSLLHSEEQGLHVYSHGGNTFGFSSEMFFLPHQNVAAVILTNRRIANAFLACVRQRLFEILFGAEHKSDEMITATVNNRRDTAARTHDRVKADPASVAWMNEFVGKYHNPMLGPATITRNGNEFWIQFESWSSRLGSEIQTDGARVIVLISAPLTAGLRIQTVTETGDLLLDGGQEKYIFKRQQFSNGTP